MSIQEPRIYFAFDYRGWTDIHCGESVCCSALLHLLEHVVRPQCRSVIHSDRLPHDRKSRALAFLAVGKRCG